MLVCIAVFIVFLSLYKKNDRPLIVKIAFATEVIHGLRLVGMKVIIIAVDMISTLRVEHAVRVGVTVGPH